jgi:stage V sporulation protein G
MEITEVKIFPVGDPKLRAFVSVVFDRCFMVNDIRVIEGRQGLFISMPNRRRRNGEFKDVAHPLNQETRTWIEQRVLSEFARISEGNDAAPRFDDPARTPEAVAGVREVPSPVGVMLDAGPAPEQSLEEVQEAHLRESFWSLG